MSAHPRQAIYWLPDGPLGAFGAAWLGWDARDGSEPAPPDLPSLPAPRAAITERPRRYGFHATLKPPLRLAPGHDPGGLEAMVASWASRTAPVPLEGLGVGTIGPFVALVRPSNDVLSAFAADCVRAFDGVRAPPGAGEVARRRAAGLTERQDRLLHRWGYPHVMEEFRFHVTLTGPLAAGERDRVAGILRDALAPHLDPPPRLDSVSLCHEGPDGFFRHRARFSLGG